MPTLHRPIFRRGKVTGARLKQSTVVADLLCSPGRFLTVAVPHFHVATPAELTASRYTLRRSGAL
jgi:hypothetical protein